MAPNLRPTLSTRIRASFDGKRSKSDFANSQTTSTFVLQDAVVLRDAIGQAINNDSFQSAIAAHLARLIEPSIKEALDTIQPVVETVYQHDILLRKTNRSVEDLLLRFDSAADKSDDRHGTDAMASEGNDVVAAEEIKQLLSEHNASNQTRFSELSNSVRDGHSTTTQALTDIADIKGALSLSSQSLASLTSTALQSTTDTFKMQEQLDEVKADIGNIIKRLEIQGNTLVRIKEADLASAEILGSVQESHASHTVALNEIKAHDQSFKSASIPIFEKTHANTATAFQTLTANLASLKENIKAGFASESDRITSLGKKINSVLSSVEVISDKDSGQEILAAIQTSNDFHSAHATALEGIKQKVSEPDEAWPDQNKDVAALAQHMSTITTALNSHTSALSELQQRTNPESHLNTIITTLDSHSGLLAAVKNGDKSADILMAVQASNESHAAHTEDLGEVKNAARAAETAHASHTADLEEIRATVASAGELHTFHKTALEGIRRIVEAASKSHASHAIALREIETSMNAISEFHASHNTAVEAIKAANDNTAASTASQLKTLEALEIKIGSVIATLGSQSTVQSEVIDAVHSSNASYASHSAELEEIKAIVRSAGESHASQTTTLESLKAANKSAAEVTAAQARTVAALETHLQTVNTNLQDQSSIHSEIRDAIHASNASHASHAAALNKAETTSSDLLSAATESRGLLTSHRDILASHTTLLENTKDAKHHEDILAAVKDSHDALVTHREVLAMHTHTLENTEAADGREDIKKNLLVLKAGVEDFKTSLDAHGEAVRNIHTEMRDLHMGIATSVHALAGGVHMNELRVTQLKDPIKAVGLRHFDRPMERAVDETHKNAKIVTDGIAVPVDADRSFVNGKSALDLGIAVIAGGGTIAVASKDGLFAHELEADGEKKPVKDSSAAEAHGVEPIHEVDPEEPLHDGLLMEETFQEAEPMKKNQVHILDPGQKIEQSLDAEPTREVKLATEGPAKNEKPVEAEHNQEADLDITVEHATEREPTTTVNSTMEVLAAEDIIKEAEVNHIGVAELEPGGAEPERGNVLAQGEPVQQPELVQEPEPSHEPEPDHVVEPVHEVELDKQELIHESRLVYVNEPGAKDPHHKTEPVDEIKPAMDDFAIKENNMDVPIHDLEPATDLGLLREIGLAKEAEPPAESLNSEDEPAINELEPEKLAVETGSAAIDLAIEPKLIAIVTPVTEDAPAETKPVHEVKAATNTEVSQKESALEEPAIELESAEKELPTDDLSMKVPDTEVEIATQQEPWLKEPAPVVQQSKNAEPIVEAESLTVINSAFDDPATEEPAKEAVLELSAKDETAGEDQPDLPELLIEDPIAEAKPTLAGGATGEIELAVKETAVKEPLTGVMLAVEELMEEVEQREELEHVLGVMPVTERDTLHEAEPFYEGKPVMEEPAAKIEPVHEAEPTTEGKSTTKVEPSLEEPALDQSAVEAIATNELTTQSKSIVAESSTREAAVGKSPEVKSGIKMPSTKAERPARVTRKVSFKEPLTEVRPAPQVDLAAEEQYPEETIMEEPPAELKPYIEVPAIEEPPGEMEMEKPTAEAEQITEHSLVGEPTPVKESVTGELAMEELAVGMKPATKERPMEVEPSVHVATELTMEEPQVEARESTRLDTAKVEPTLSKEVEEEPILKRSSIEAETTFNAAVEPAMEHALEEQPATDNEPVAESDRATDTEPNVEKATVDEGTLNESFVELRPAAEESAKEIEVEPAKDTEPGLNGRTMKDYVVEDPIVHDPVVREPAVESQEAIESAVEEPTVETKAVVDENPWEATSMYELAMQDRAIEEPTVHEPIVPEPLNEQPIVGGLHTRIEPAMDVEPASEEPVVKEKEKLVEEPSTESETIVKQPTVEYLATEELTTTTDAKKSTIEESAMGAEAAKDKPARGEPSSIAQVAEIEPVLEKQADMNGLAPEPASIEPFTRVDSGIEVEPATPIKSTVESEHPAEPEPLQMVMEEPATEEPTAKMPMEETRVKHAMQEQAGKNTAMHGPLYEDPFFDVRDEPVTENQPAKIFESAPEKSIAEDQQIVESPLAEEPVAGASVIGNPVVEKPATATATHVMPELHIEVQPATKQEHSRVDSGIDVETPTREPPGKLEPVVEVKPAADIGPVVES